MCTFNFIHRITKRNVSPRKEFLPPRTKERDTSRSCLRAWKIASVPRVAFTCRNFPRAHVLRAVNPSPRERKKGGKVYNSEYSIIFTQICQE